MFINDLKVSRRPGIRYVTFRISINMETHSSSNVILRMDIWRVILFLNLANDLTIERIITPLIALTIV
ncbi:hypothetical protein RND81_11G091700 [Saponaria officinalis]|uniref:Uncharacterized protein n=1 Tax=Saponaria officinalis TaxID=3572 RepID=A0AAW1HJV7_SAPOF